MNFELVIRIIIFAIPILFSVVVHEVSHGWIAYKLGDSTAKSLGRLTLNPIPHIDLVGTIILPFAMIVLGGPVFGWAKPVPFNPNNFNRNIDVKNGIMWVALAGPVSNLILAFIFSFLFAFVYSFGPINSSSVFFLAMQFFSAFIQINIILACFNLIPIPPLDGSKILLRFLPSKYADYFLMMERYGFLILIILLATGVLSNLIVVTVRHLYKMFLFLPMSLFG